MAEGEEGRNGELWCLRRVGGNQERLLLPEGEEVTVGRGIGVTYQLVSTSSPLMLSRTHCIFRQNTEGQWTVTDNKSLNGVWVNHQQVEPQSPHALTKGCSVQLGVPLPNADKSEFEYELVRENLEQIRPFLVRPLSGKSKSQGNKRKMNPTDCEASGTEVGTSKTKLPRRELPKPDLSKQSTVPAEQEETDLDVMAATQQPCSNELQLSSMRESIAELRSLNARAQEKHTDLQKLRDPQQGPSEVTERPLKYMQELIDIQGQMVIARKEHLQRVSELQRMQREQQSKSSSTQSKTAEEAHPKEELGQLLQEHSLLMEELNHHHWEIERIIQDKNREPQETKKEKEEEETQKEDVQTQMNDVLDNELQCIICSEHFIEAVTLNCAHSFCSFCIQSWRKRKDECPICRQAITSQARSLVLDNCINRMVEKLSQEMKDRRLALILERKDLPLPVDPIPVDSDSSSAFSLLSEDDSDTDVGDFEDSSGDSMLDSGDDDCRMIIFL